MLNRGSLFFSSVPISLALWLLSVILRLCSYSMAGNSDLADFFRLEATFDPISAVTREKVRAAYGTRQTVVEEWKRKKRLGQGAFGTVWLEEEAENGHLRAVKEVLKNGSTTARIDYTRELEALGRLSKVCFCPEVPHWCL
jgi:hypothetical protein